MSLVNTLSPPSATDRYFFRTADKMRLDGCVHAVGQEGQNLTLFCEEEALLDHYMQLLLSDLRVLAPQHKIEVYFPTSPDSLIARFNEALADQNINEAARHADHQAPGQIWVIHDPSAIAEAEMQLLGRLIQSLPGARIRLILLLTGAQHQGFTLSALKRQMLRWDIDLPSPEQSMAALEYSEHSGQLLHLRRLLNKICAKDPDLAARVQGWHPARAQEPDLALQNSGHVGQQMPTPSTHDTPVAAASSLRRKSIEPAQWRTLGLLLGSALIVSTGLMMWMQPQAFGIGPQVTPTNQASSEKLEIIESASPEVTPPKPKFIRAGNGTTVSSAQPKLLKEQPVTESTDKSQLSTTRSAPVTAVSAAASEPAKRLNDPQAAAQWLRSLPPQTFLIWYASPPTYDAALELRRSYTTLASSVIVSTMRAGQKNPIFAIVSEPFDTAGQAYQALKTGAFPKGNWVRNAKDIQAELAAMPAVERRN